jgi:hypothetical protein
MSRDAACQRLGQGIVSPQIRMATIRDQIPDRNSNNPGFGVQDRLKGKNMTQPKMKQALLVLGLATAVLASASAAQEGKSVDQSGKPIERKSRIFIAPIEGGFDTFLAAAIIKKQVPVVVVTDKTKADYEITGIANTEKAGWAKMLFMGTDNSNDLASFKMVRIDNDEVVYGYSVRKGNSYRGKQSAAEACAKHLKERIEGK